jgi:hypothetical protein
VLITPPSSRGAANFFDTHIKGTARRGSRFEASMEEEKDKWPIIRNATIAALIVMLGAIVVDLLVSLFA